MPPKIMETLTPYLGYIVPAALALGVGYLHMAIRWEVSRGIKELNGTYRRTETCEAAHKAIDQHFSSVEDLHLTQHEIVMDELARLKRETSIGLLHP